LNEAITKREREENEEREKTSMALVSFRRAAETETRRDGETQELVKMKGGGTQIVETVHLDYHQVVPYDPKISEQKKAKLKDRSEAPHNLSHLSEVIGIGVEIRDEN
jgi:hypothetical protein